MIATNESEDLMFARDTSMTLTDVFFTTETEDDETRRVVGCAFKLSPLTAAHAEALGVRTVLFETSSGALRPVLDAAVLQIAVEDQRLSLAKVPGVHAPLVIPNVRIERLLRVKVKHDREPVACDAVLKVTFSYPDADALLTLASAVGDTLFVTFEPEQGDLLTAEDDAEPIRRTGKKGDTYGSTAH
jgi:hypothetical protein